MAQVTEYRLKFFGPDGNLEKTVVLLCRDDAQALRAAEDFRDGRAMELRKNERLVGAFAATGGRST
jgi:hypothetical protein